MACPRPLFSSALRFGGKNRWRHDKSQLLHHVTLQSETALAFSINKMADVSDLIERDLRISG